MEDILQQLVSEAVDAPAMTPIAVDCIWLANLLTHRVSTRPGVASGARSLNLSAEEHCARKGAIDGQCLVRLAALYM